MAAIASQKPVSSIAVAFAGHSGSYLPLYPDRKEGAGPDHRSLLLTPPNSISPTHPAHKQGAGVRATPCDWDIDRDIDLQDAVEHAAAQDLVPSSSALSREALAGLEEANQITPAILAKYHLPKIFLGNRSMPVRAIMAQLAQSVPGYSSIQPAKARRLVVAALEHRAGGGLHGEVVFEKVGWGRWRVKGQQPLPGQGVPIGARSARSGLTPPPSVESSGGLRIPRVHNMHDEYTGSWAAGSPLSYGDEEMADGMSLDGSDTSDSDSSDRDDVDMDMDDQTEDEDWSAVGPDALRSGALALPRQARDYNLISRMSEARLRTASSQSVPSRAGRVPTPSFSRPSRPFASRAYTGPVHTASSFGVNKSELEAVEALVSMGSM
jgi:hypothetical protein